MNGVCVCVVHFMTHFIPTHIHQDGTKLFSAGASKQGGKLLDVTTGQTMSYAQHDAPISCTAFCEVSGMQNVLVTGSWDKSVKVRVRVCISQHMLTTDECAH